MVTAPTIEQLEAARLADLGRLVADAAAGKPLTAAERRLVDSELARLKAEMAAGGRAVAARAAGRRRQPWAEIAEAYGISERTAKYWEARGIEAGDPVPWDEPALIPTWYPRHHRGRTLPGEVWRKVAAAGKVQNTGVGAFNVQPSLIEGERAAPSSVEQTMRSAFDTLSREISGLDRELTALKAVPDQDEGLIRSKRDELLSCMEKARQLSKGIQQDLVNSGKYVAVDKVVRELTAIHTAVRGVMRTEFRRAELELRSTANSDAWGAQVDVICDLIDRMLCEGEFAEAV